MSDCPAERFAVLDGIAGVQAAFLQRCPGIDVSTDRETALARLAEAHRDAARDLGFPLPFATAEQVHGHRTAWIRTASDAPAPGADALITGTPGLTLAIYVADCAPVYLVDSRNRAIGLVHSGKKGTESGIVPKTLAAMHDAFGTEPAETVLQIGPCIRPPCYETDFAAEIIRQARETGVVRIHDCGVCTACEPERYYSYRREKGRTGRLLALLALRESV